MTDAVIEFDGLCKDFGETSVLKGIDARAGTGEVIGLVGLNGSGKTTLLETALGFSPPTEGAAYLFGRNSMDELDRRTKARIGFVPQHDELLDNITGRKYLKLVAAFYRRWNQELIDRLGRDWTVPLDQTIRSLSTGQRQKLSILSALGHEPDLLVLDEPVASLDPMARRLFLRELVEIASSQTRTIVFSTHIVSDLERICSRVWLLKDGRIAMDDELEAMKEGCARIQLPHGISAPASLPGMELIHRRSERDTTVLLFRNWNETLHAELEKATRCTLSPQWLGLEDIFLEVHS